MRRRILPILFAFACTTDPGRADVIDLRTRDTTIRVLVEGPERPSHVVALFAGGDGAVEIRDDGTVGWLKGNFAVRTRTLLHGHGMATAVVGAPGDNRGLKGTRSRDDYARDIEAVAAYLRGRFKGLPLWMHGTSRGTISIAYTVPKFRDQANRPDGIVLSASVTERSDYDTVFDGDLAAIAGAALVVHHKDDPCYVTPPHRATDVLDALAAARPKRLILFEGGGENAKGSDCGAKSHHGFIDIEERVIDAVAAFVKAPG